MPDPASRLQGVATTPETCSNGGSAGMVPAAGPTGRCALTENPTPSGDHWAQFSCQQPARPIAAAALTIEPTARPAMRGQGTRPPAPNAESCMVLSLCRPKQPALHRAWKPPAVQSAGASRARQQLVVACPRGMTWVASAWRRSGWPGTKTKGGWATAGRFKGDMGRRWLGARLRTGADFRKEKPARFSSPIRDHSHYDKLVFV
jgi:hypothetical protein